MEHYQWLALVAYVPLALVLRRAEPLSGFLAGMLFGVVLWAAGTWWLVHSMGTMMHLPLWKGVGATVLIWLYQGLWFGFFGLICGWMNKHGLRAGPLFSAGLFTLLLFLRPRLFPVSGAVSVALWPEFIQVADLGGEYLVLFLLLLLNWLFAHALLALCQGKRRSVLFNAAGFILLLGLVLGYGAWRVNEFGAKNASPGSPALTVVSVQPNVPVRWGTSDHPLAAFSSAAEICLRSLSAHKELVEKAGMILFPEMPRFQCLDSEFVSSGLLGMLQHLNIPALLPSDEYAYGTETMVTTKDGDRDRALTSRKIFAKYNSVFVLEPGKNPTLVYRKVRLVPFSEATPLRSVFPSLQKVFGHSLEVTEGDGPRLVSVGDFKIQPLICFESGFPELVRRGVAMGADVLMEVSNDGWFASRESEMRHLGMGIFRTVEFRRPLVRCNNTGSSAFIRTSGELVANTLTPHDRACVTSADVVSSEARTVYGLWGNYWLWGLVMIVVWRLARYSFGKTTLDGSGRSCFGKM